MKPAVVIPTYWTNRQGEPTDRLFNIYDHPTPINQVGTLHETLKSLRIIEGDFKVIIIAVATEATLYRELEEKLGEEVKKFAELDITFFSWSNLEVLRRRAKDLGHGDFVSFLSLDGYSNIRNLCLIIPHILGHEVVFLIDDDEIVIDKDCLKKALEFMGGEFEGKPVYGKAGYYLSNEGGNYLGSDDVCWWDTFWRKGWAMNQVLKTIKQPPRLKITSLALGGAMVIHRKLFEKVMFDPYIVRGEDIDYLINAKLEGFDFFLDNELSILHRPPLHKNHVLGLRQDIYRFVYEQRKLEYAKERGQKGVELEELDPFPGLFLRPNIVFKSVMISLCTALNDIMQGDFLKHLSNVKVALKDARSFAKKNRHKYFGLKHRWVSFMESVGQDEALKAYLLEGKPLSQGAKPEEPWDKLEENTSSTKTNQTTPTDSETSSQTQPAQE